jgi:hypothetical protein
LGKGTYLPRHDHNAEQDDGFSEVQKDTPAGDGEVVMVIDDEPTIRMLISEILEEQGYATIEASDVRPGLKVLFITGYAENAVVGNGHLEKGMQMIAKPFEMDALARKIREIIESI